MDTVTLPKLKGLHNVTSFAVAPGALEILIARQADF